LVVVVVVEVVVDVVTADKQIV